RAAICMAPLPSRSDFTLVVSTSSQRHPPNDRPWPRGENCAGFGGDNSACYKLYDLLLDRSHEKIGTYPQRRAHRRNGADSRRRPPHALRIDSSRLYPGLRILPDRHNGVETKLEAA